MHKEILKKAGYKITKPREAVIGFLENKKRPLSVAEIYDGLKDGLDQVTVYRVLEVLEEAGIVFKEQVQNKATYYLADKQHHHIICRQCGHSECLPCEHIFKKVKNFKKIKHQLILTGLCDKCAG